jgi:hypothetical protein
MSDKIPTDAVNSRFYIYRKYPDELKQEGKRFKCPVL